MNRLNLVQKSTHIIFDYLYEHVSHLEDVRNIQMSKYSDAIGFLHVKDEYVKPMWFFVTEYRDGILRIRNDLDPKNEFNCLWAYEYPKERKFELSFLPEEIDATFCTNLARFLGNNYLSWTLFDWQTSYPEYAWTKLAKEKINKLTKSK